MLRLSRVATGGFHASAHLLLGLVLVLFIVHGCGDDNPTGPNGDDTKGYIAGTAFILDDQYTTQIKIEIFESDTHEKVSTVFPNDEGQFTSDPLDGGVYDLTASVDLPGYFPGREDNITVVPGRTTTVEIAVQDTSRVRFENLLPESNTLLVERKPRISGEFRAAGAGYRLSSFAMRINGDLIADVQVEELDPLHHARFEYTPPVNLPPGLKTVQLSIFTRANNPSEVSWSFYILEGVPRRVPSEYGTIQEAVFHSNDGDTVLVAPGTYDVDNVDLIVDLVVLSEGGPQATTLRALGNRHFRVSDADRRATIKGFTLTGGRTSLAVPGGSIRVDEADVVVEDCVFTDNQSGDRAGAIALFDTNSKIRDCRFVANRGYRGGAIAIFDQSSPEISGCVFIRNVGTNGLGGAIFVRSADASIHNNTFYRNSSANGSGIFLDFDLGPANVFSDSNIFVENEASQTGATIFFNQSNLSSNCDGFHRNQGLLIDGLGASPGISSMLDLPSGTDAGFCDLPAEDLHLRPDSPFLAGQCERGAYPPGCIP